MSERTRTFNIHSSATAATRVPADRAGAGQRWLRVVVLIWVGIVAGAVARGQDPADTPPPAPANQSQAVAKVVSVRSMRKQPDRAGRHDRIFVKVTNLDALLKQGPIMLYLNGGPAPLVQPPVPRSDGELEFRLEPARTEAAHQSWNNLCRPLTFARKVDVSVGPASGAIEPAGEAVRITLIVIPVGPFWAWLILCVILVGMVVYLGKRTKMLRDSGPSSATDGTWNRYSLSRTQMAFWFVLIVGSFGFIWLVTGQVDTLTASVVALAGISASTALSAVMIDAGKENAAAAELADLAPQREALQGAVAAGAEVEGAASDPAAMQQLGGNQAKLEGLTKKIGELRKQVTARPCKAFVRDILSDANGVSLHRLQIFVWTIVLGIIFVQGVCDELAMPEFNSTLLALMGVSAGTYVGFKFPEQKQ